MSNIEVEKIIEPVAASDGAGVKLKRSIGTHLINYHDPFLMLDEFGSENKDDYIGGFIKGPIGNLITRASALAITVVMINAFALAHRDWFITTKLFTSEQIFLFIIGLYFLIKGNR